MDKILDQNYELEKIEKFLQELAWRDYWQQVWRTKGEDINKDLKRPQPDVQNYNVPKAIVNSETGIQVIDQSVQLLYTKGYVHNHVRMYIASIACNIGKSHWLAPAKWMYYHLLDADWGSNALSWQWVAGSNSSKKYIANQQNINKYCYTNQSGTFLDLSYEELGKSSIPKVLENNEELSLHTVLPENYDFTLNDNLPTLIYNFYNLDPNWRKNEKVNRILLLEPSTFKAYPISQNSLSFMLDLSQNIQGIKLYVGEYDNFLNEHQPQKICFKEHPLNKHYKGQEEKRDWMFDVEGYFPSFFAFWKKCKKQL